MTSHVETIMARRQVTALIAADPTTVAMNRKVKVPDNSGGWRWGNPTPGAPIIVLLTSAKRRLSDVLVNTEMGDVPTYPYLLLAPHDADIRRGDTFSARGDEYEIKSVHPKPGISMTAQVDYFGGATNG